MQADKRGRGKSNEGKKVKEQKKQKEHKEEVKNEDPLKFFVQMGDCSPQIYQLAIAFNPAIAYDKINFDEKFLRSLVEETNAALVPVLQKHIEILKKLQG